MPHEARPRDRAGLFFALGLVLFVACTTLSIFWLPIFRWILQDPNLIYASRPSWLHMLLRSVDFVPWIVGAALVFLAHSFPHRDFDPVPYFGGVLTVPALAILWLFIWPVAEQLVVTTPFDDRSWKQNAGTDTQWPARLRMVDDLVANHELKGSSKTEIIRLLGPPDETSYWTDWDLVYWLGPERSFIRIDSEWLLLRLGPNDEVVEYTIARD